MYITPENIMENSMFMKHAGIQGKLVALVVDEAHCIKMWDDKFWKVFSMIGNLRSLVPSAVNVMALSYSNSDY